MPSKSPREGRAPVSSERFYRPRWFTEMATRTISFTHVLAKTARLCSRTCAERLSSSGVSGGGDTCVPEPRDGLSDEAEAEGYHSERRDRFSLAPVSPPRELQTALDNVLKCKQY